jgi:hypothetical protein
MSNNTYNDMNNNYKITNLDLYSNQYNEKILEQNIMWLSQHTILTTQNNLSNEFIWKYILNSKYNKFKEDNDITIYDILAFYPNFK